MPCTLGTGLAPTDLLKFSQFEVVEGAKYWEAYNDLIDSYGVQFLDALCCNEIELWLEELNTRIGVPIPEPRFTMRPRRSGLHGYANSADLLCDGMPCGLIGWGAANHGCMVSFSGVGLRPSISRLCTLLSLTRQVCASLGWISPWMTTAENTSLTRAR